LQHSWDVCLGALNAKWNELDEQQLPLLVAHKGISDGLQCGN